MVRSASDPLPWDLPETISLTQELSPELSTKTLIPLNAAFMEYFVFTLKQGFFVYAETKWEQHNG